MTVLGATVKQHSKKIVLGDTVKQHSKKIVFMFSWDTWREDPKYLLTKRIAGKVSKEETSDLGP